MRLRMALTSGSSCHHLLCAGITDLYYLISFLASPGCKLMVVGSGFIPSLNQGVTDMRVVFVI